MYVCVSALYEGHSIHLVNYLEKKKNKSFQSFFLKNKHKLGIVWNDLLQKLF